MFKLTIPESMAAALRIEIGDETSPVNSPQSPTDDIKPEPVTEIPLSPVVTHQVYKVKNESTTDVDYYQDRQTSGWYT